MEALFQVRGILLSTFSSTDLALRSLKEFYLFPRRYRRGAHLASPIEKALASKLHLIQLPLPLQTLPNLATRLLR